MNIRTYMSFCYENISLWRHTTRRLKADDDSSLLLCIAFRVLTTHVQQIMQRERAPCLEPLL